MPALVNQNSFIIRPADDLLKQHPHIKRLSSELASAYANHKVLVDDEHLKIIGSALWQALALDKDFAEHQQQSGNHITPIIIESNQPLIQQLPWETLYHESAGFLGRQQAYSLSRRLPDAVPYTHAPEKGPLRILLFTAMTEDQSRLNVEDEQANVQEALMSLVKEGIVILKMPDDGRFSSFHTIVKEFQPHVLFISGHGIFHGNELNSKGAEAHFLFEEEQGLGSHPVNQIDIANALHGIPLECIILSACQSGMASSDNLSSGLMTHLAAQGIPYIIGMRESIFDTAGIQFARTFCAAVAKQERVDIALQAARESITLPFKGYRKDKTDAAIEALSFGQWCLPALISQEPSRALIDWDFTPQPPKPISESETLNSVTLAKHFIGRRLQLRELALKLQVPGYKQLLITGPGGQGKTALAGKLVQNQQQAEQQVLAWSARPEHEWDDFQFELELLLDENNAKRYERESAKSEDKLSLTKVLLGYLCQQYSQGLVIFFDNLESIQDPTSLALTDNNFSHWIQQIQILQPDNLTLILTSRWKLPNWPDQDTLSLEHLSYNDYLQLTRQTQLSHKLLENPDRLRQVHQILHGNARALEFFAAASLSMTDSEEALFLQALEQAKADIQVDMALDAVIQHRSSEEKQLLEQMTAYHTPVPKEGIIRLAIDEQENTYLHLMQLVNVSLVEKSFDYQLETDEYQCSPLVKDWLENNNGEAPSIDSLQIASAYQYYLFKHQRNTLPQAITCYHAFMRADEKESAFRLALDVIVETLILAGLYSRVLEDWLPEICNSDNLQIGGRAICKKGELNFRLGDSKVALKYFEQSLSIQKEIGDNLGAGVSLNNISQIIRTHGDNKAALKYLEQSLAIHQKIDNKSGEGSSFNNIAISAHTRGDYTTALKYFEKSLTIMQEIGDKSREGTALNNISQIYRANGDDKTALKYLKQSLTIQLEIGSKSDLGSTLNNIAQIFKARGDCETALKYFEQSLNIQQEIGNKSGEGITLNNISLIYSERNDYEKALNYLEKALVIMQETGDESGLCTALYNVGDIHARNKANDKAVITWLIVYKLAKRRQFIQALNALSALAPKLGMPEGLEGWEALLNQLENE